MDAMLLLGREPSAKKSQKRTCLPSLTTRVRRNFHKNAGSTFEQGLARAQENKSDIFTYLEDRGGRAASKPTHDDRSYVSWRRETGS